VWIFLGILAGAGVLIGAIVWGISEYTKSRAAAEATTALVLKVVDGDTVDIVDDVRGRLRIRLLGIDTPETKKPGYTVGCWVPRHRSSRSRPCSGSASRSSPTRRKGCTTGTAGHWPTSTRRTAGTIRWKRREQARRCITSWVVDPAERHVRWSLAMSEI
jgi:hypothetical protein